MDFILADASNPLRVAITAVVAYVALVIMLRISGKRTLSDMNAFDFVVTVALGSTLAATITSDTVSIAEGLSALLTLIIMQAVIALIASRSPGFQSLIKSEPRLLLHRGELLEDAMRAERLTKAEVMAAVRAHGHGDLADVYAVVLETNGELSVITQSPSAEGGAFASVDALRRG